MRVGRFILNFKVAGPSGELNPELDEDRSNFPQDMTSGVANMSTASVYQVLSAFSSYWFKLETVIIDNQIGVNNKVVFYNGPSASATAFAIQIKPSDTVILGKDQLRGLWFTSGVFVSNLQSGTVRVGGKLIASIATGQL